MRAPDAARLLACCIAVAASPAALAQTLPHRELSEKEVQYLEAFEAPGVIFNERLCDPPLSSMSKLCTQLPLDYDQPFTHFPVALRFFDPSRPETLAAERLANRRGDSNDDLTQPNFFLLGASHALVSDNARGETEYRVQPLDSIPVLKAGEQYNSTLAIARQRGGGFLNLQQRVVVPSDTVIYRPRPSMRGVEWRQCMGETAALVPAHTTGKIPNSHHYKGGGDCGARYVVKLWGQRSQREVTSYIFRHSVNFNVGEYYRTLSQSWRIGPKDPPGFYTFEWWYAGKLLSRTRFEVKP
ncbi:hypothetical protein [Uliginosibacterium aquaticum]|uniref:Uncharacterized protein n=1 Tax=Uliginosibacterium aquaticum TaxID=2731212 RepID=A0ABX2IGN0_9RHOO|nr:hypothetical protein [Uliginosibacterium aquaticum]NSL53498.1 hypothetical protein [Uliginosibacterium aquaticum]